MIVANEREAVQCFVTYQASQMTPGQIRILDNRIFVHQIEALIEKNYFALANRKNIF